MRSMWKGLITFGLVGLPVRLYLAADSPTTSLTRRLHAACLTPIQLRAWCPRHECQVADAEIVRGIEVARDQFAAISAVDLEALPSPVKHQIAVEGFVSLDEARLVTRFARQTYYLEPEPAGRVAFALLRDLLADRGLLALGRVTLRDRERMAAIEPVGPVLLLTTVAWPDEVRSTRTLDLPGEVTVPERQRRVAGQLAAAMTVAYDPAAFQNSYQTAFDAMVAGTTAAALATQPASTGTAGLSDLMAALEASVAQTRAARSGDHATRRRRGSRGHRRPSSAARRGGEAASVALGERRE